MATASLLREKPLKTRNGLPNWLATLIAFFATVASLCTIPYALGVWLHSRPHKSLKSWLICHFVRVRGQVAPIMREEESYHTAASMPVPMIMYPRGLKKLVDVLVIDVPPLPRSSKYLARLEIPKPIKAVQRPAFVLTPPGALGAGTEKTQPGEKLVIYIHGGGYVIGHPMWTPFGYKLARDLRTRILCVQYRKTVSSTTAFPTPLLDSLSVWHYAINTMGFRPKDIVVVGDSAGGHLTLALATQLSRSGSALPSALGLSSPWCDLTFSFASLHEFERVDFISFRLGMVIIPSLTRYYTSDAVRSALLSPALAPAGSWKGLVKAGTKVFVQLGAREVLYDEGEALISGLRRDGVYVDVHVEEDGFHCGALMGFSGQQAYQEFKGGIERLLKA